MFQINNCVALFGVTTGSFFQKALLQAGFVGNFMGQRSGDSGLVVKPEKYEPVEDLELVKDKELNEKLATLLNNFWTLQWKAVSDEVEKASTQGWCIHLMAPESNFLTGLFR